MLFATNRVHHRAASAFARASTLSEGASAREQAHIKALGHWCAGSTRAAGRVWEEILAEYPHDILALRLHHANAFWMGRNYALRNGVARVFPAWDETVPGFGYVQGMFAFGLEECGEYAPAETLGRKAFESDPEDLWAIHAVAHVLEMQGRLKEGEEWLDYPADRWEDRNPFRGHLWWHRALFLLEQGRYEETLALYDRSIHTEKTEFYLDIQNQAALLLRLELHGVDVGGRWAELADDLEERIDDHALAFTDLHTALALAAAGRSKALNDQINSLKVFAGLSGNSTAEITQQATIPIALGLSAFRLGRYDDAIKALQASREDWPLTGGSHAQRDLFQQVLLEAALRAGRYPLARALAQERIALKPHSKGNWTKYSQILSETGDEAALARAQKQMKEAAQY